METEPKEVEKKIDDYYNDVDNKLVLEQYQSETLFNIIGKERNETVHNNFLKWFFSQNEWNVISIKRIIQRIVDDSSNIYIFPEELVENIRLGTYELSISEVKKEVPCYCKLWGKRQTVRVDLVISCNLAIEGNGYPLKIIIENKVDSPEHDNQTWKYYAYFSNNASECRKKGIEAYVKKNNYDSKNEIHLFLFLLPESNQTSISCDKFIRITYQDLYEYVFKSLLGQVPVNVNERQIFFLREYMRNLITPYVDEKNNISIMAYEEEDVEKLEKFWKTNLPLFKLVAEVISKKSDDAEYNDKIKSVVRGIESLGKIKTYDLILPDGGRHDGKRMKEIAKEIVLFLLRNSSVEEVKALLPQEVPLINYKDYQEKKIKSTDAKFGKRWDNLKGDKKIHLDNPLYLSNQWTAERFETFKEKLSKAYPEISVKESGVIE